MQCGSNDGLMWDGIEREDERWEGPKKGKLPSSEDVGQVLILYRSIVVATFLDNFTIVAYIYSTSMLCFNSWLLLTSKSRSWERRVSCLVSVKGRT